MRAYVCIVKIRQEMGAMEKEFSRFCVFFGKFGLPSELKLKSHEKNTC